MKRGILLNNTKKIIILDQKIHKDTLLKNMGSVNDGEIIYFL
jgi:hypothetical protein